MTTVEERLQALEQRVPQLYMQSEWTLDFEKEVGFDEFVVGRPGHYSHVQNTLCAGIKECAEQAREHTEEQAMHVARGELLVATHNLYIALLRNHRRFVAGESERGTFRDLDSRNDVSGYVYEAAKRLMIS